MSALKWYDADPQDDARNSHFTGLGEQQRKSAIGFMGCRSHSGPAAPPFTPTARGGAVPSRRKQMAEPKHIDIVRRAYEIWQQFGEPEGRDEEFYLKAKEELSAGLSNGADTREDRPD
jgi:hypothetical protein